MRIDVQTENGIVTVRPMGKLDAVTAAHFQEAMNHLLQNDVIHIVIDMSDVPYVSSCGLRVFVHAAKQLMGTGNLAVAALQVNVQQAFELAGFGRIMHVCDDVAAARQCVV